MSKTSTDDAIAAAHAQAVAADMAARAADQEQADALALAASLERRVVDGDESITPAELTTAKELSGFARLRAQAAAKKADKARRDHRRAELDTLAAQLHAHQADPASFDDALTAVESALEQFVTLFAQRRAAVVAFRTKMQQLGVPAVDNRFALGHGAPEHAGMQWATPGPGGPGVAVAGRILTAPDPAPYLSAVLHRLSTRHSLNLQDQEIRDLMGLHGPHDLHAHLRAEL